MTYHTINLKNMKFNPEFLKFLIGDSCSANTAQQTVRFSFANIEIIKDKSEKIRKLTSLMNDSAASEGEKRNAKRIIEKLTKEREHENNNLFL